MNDILLYGVVLTHQPNLETESLNLKKAEPDSLLRRPRFCLVNFTEQVTPDLGSDRRIISLNALYAFLYTVPLTCV